MAIQCNGEILPLSLTIKVGQKEHHVSSFSPELYGDNGKITILEEYSLDISLLSDEGFKETTSFLEIEVQDSREVITIHVGEPQNLYSHNGGFPFRLGYSTVRLFCNDSCYTNLIKICPIHLDETQVGMIHDYLEETYRGMCYDLLERKRGHNNPRFQFNKWHHDYARFHVEHNHEILSLVEGIKSDKLYHLEKKYLNGHTAQRIDSKVIKLGIMKPFDRKGELTHYSKKHLLQIDLELCAALKHIITNWISNIESVLDMVNKEAADTDDAIAKLNLDSIWAYDKYRSLPYNASTVYSYYLSNKSIVNKKKIKELELHLSIYNEWLDSLCLIKNRFSKLLNEPEFSQIRLIPRRQDYKFNDRSLKRFYQLYKNSKFDSRANAETRKRSPIVKPTWQVYEYYVVFKIIELLTGVGYSPADEFYGDFEKTIFQGIPNGQGFSLTNETHRIEITFNEELPRNRHDAENFNKLFYTMNRNAPDIRIELYDIQPAEEKFLGMLVIDAKHKNFSGIYSERYNTKDMEQLDSYYRIKYRDPKTKTGRQAVDKVICVYSGRDSVDIKNYEDVTYISLFPQISQQGEMITIGEDELAKEFYEWVGTKID